MSAIAASLQLRYYPDPVLETPAEPIEHVDDEVRAVAERMIELMHQHQGVGLAGPQVGLGWRLFVFDLTGEADKAQVMINPVLSEPTRATEASEEGCLSLPDIHGKITRPVGITIDALDHLGQPVRFTEEGLIARIWQHEYDHLDGVLITDRMPPLDRTANKRALRELEKAAR